MAAQAALSTYELLEKVLAYLPAEDLNNARLVRSDWNAMSLRSLGTRQTLFLHPEPVHDFLGFHDRARNRTKFPYITRTPKSEVDTYTITDSNPLLSGKAWCNIEWRNPNTLFFRFPLLEQMQTWPSLWQDQFLTQPPVEEITLHYWATKLHKHSKTRNISNPSGLRFKDIIQALSEMKAEMGNLENWVRDTDGRLVRRPVVCDIVQGRVTWVVLEKDPSVLKAREIEKALAKGVAKPKMLDVDSWGVRGGVSEGDDEDEEMVDV